MNPVSSFLLRHERLLLVAAAFVVLYFSVGKLQDFVAERDKARADAAERVLAETKKENQDLRTFYQEDRTRREAENAALVKAMTVRTQAVTKQQQVDATLPLTELGDRWKSLLFLKPTDIQKRDTGLLVSPLASVSTVQQLEKIPALESNLKTQEDINTSNLASLATQTNRIDGLNKQATEADNACNAKIKVVKDDAKKHSRKWFKIGAAVGAIGVTAARLILHF